MNDKINDVAFEPMDKAGTVASGPNADGTVTYQIVEGDTFVDGKLVAKEPEVVGTIQIEENHD